MIKTPLNLAMLGDPQAEQYCDILDLASLLGDLAVGCNAGQVALESPDIPGTFFVNGGGALLVTG